MGIILMGRRVDAHEAFRLGFVNEVVPSGQVLKHALDWSAELLKGSPMAIRAAKELVYQGLDAESFAHAYSEQKKYPAVRALYESEDRIEGPQAFAEKRKRFAER